MADRTRDLRDLRWEFEEAQRAAAKEAEALRAEIVRLQGYLDGARAQRDAWMAAHQGAMVRADRAEKALAELREAVQGWLDSWSWVALADGKIVAGPSDAKTAWQMALQAPWTVSRGVAILATEASPMRAHVSGGYGLLQFMGIDLKVPEVKRES